MKIQTRLGCLALTVAAAASMAATHSVSADVVDVDSGKSVGKITFVDSEFGLLVEPRLSGLQPGLHAVHIHENPDCGESEDGTPAGRAGDHYDPAGKGSHEGPYGDGHLGDLPNITVEADGSATVEVLAPRVRAEDLLGRAVVIHLGADRYDQHSMHTHGKGGARMFCGVIR